jgi:hypothetical protein
LITKTFEADICKTVQYCYEADLLDNGVDQWVGV